MIPIKYETPEVCLCAGSELSNGYNAKCSRANLENKLLLIYIT